MRGKALHKKEATYLYRITPAYAGKSRQNMGNFCQSWDHPRLCGEKEYRVKKTKVRSGSPPPMRGKGRCCTSCSSRVRITPAYAGKSQ